MDLTFPDGPAPAKLVATWETDDERGRSRYTSTATGDDLRRLLALPLDAFAEPTDLFASVVHKLAAITEHDEATRGASTLRLRVVSATTGDPVPAPAVELRNDATDEVLHAGVLSPPADGEMFATVETVLGLHTTLTVSAEGYLPMTLRVPINSHQRTISARLVPL